MNNNNILPFVHLVTELPELKLAVTVTAPPKIGGKLR